MLSLVLSIGLISFLNRREELSVPSWPAESTRTGMALAFAVVAPRIPAIKVCLWLAPMRIVFDSSATPSAPISMLLSPVVRLSPAEKPRAMLLLPVLLASALAPLAVLKSPATLLASALAPLAVLELPVILLTRANAPSA